MSIMHKQVRAFVKATNDEVPVEIKQKIVDNVYKDIQEKPCKEDLTICPVDRNSSASAQKRRKVDRFTSIINKFIGF